MKYTVYMYSSYTLLRMIDRQIDRLMKRVVKCCIHTVVIFYGEESTHWKKKWPVTEREYCKKKKKEKKTSVKMLTKHVRIDE